MAPSVWPGSSFTLDTDPSDYELGTVFTTTGDITISGVRVWADASEEGFPNRKARIWDIGSGTPLATVDLPTNFATGWNVSNLGTPLELAAGTYLVSYSTGGRYSFVSGGLNSDVVSGDGVVKFPATASVPPGNGRINNDPTVFPSSGSPGVFWGVDLVYTVGFGSNTRPVITGLSVVPTGLGVVATVTATDEEGLGGASYTWSWGDGTSSTVTSVANAAHTYASGGTYAVAVVVQDSEGLYAVYSTTVVVTSGGLFRPNSELVAVAWLKGVSYLGTRVATELPRQLSGWSASGFVVVSAAGGTGAQYTPMRQPVVDVQTVAVAPESGRPPWSQSSQMAEQIIAATLDHPTVPRRVTMPSGYRSAFVRSVWVVNEPRRVPADPGDFARFSLDMALDWVEIPS